MRVVRSFFLLLLLPMALQAKIHAIIAIDTLCEHMELAMEQNLRQWRYFLIDLQRSSGIEVEDVYFTGEELTWNHVKEYITSLSVACDDTILFFSSTHGTRSISKELPWPDLHWSTEWRTVDSIQIVTLLREKKPRLLVMITEACNTYRDWYDSPMVPMALAVQTPREVKKENYQKLFLETKGEVIATSAGPGEFSWVLVPARGGIYTNCFFESLKEIVNGRRGPVDWATLLDTTADKVSKDSGSGDSQHPIYQISTEHGVSF